jgi:molybdopterin-containing oxidoreductase family membrane subunit
MSFFSLLFLLFLRFVPSIAVAEVKELNHEMQHEAAHAGEHA